MKTSCSHHRVISPWLPHQLLLAPLLLASPLPLLLLPQQLLLLLAPKPPLLLLLLQSFACTPTCAAANAPPGSCCCSTCKGIISSAQHNKIGPHQPSVVSELLLLNRS
jgi:hypothetical protein